MKTLVEIEKILNENKSFLQKNYFVKKMGVFGSYVKNTQEKASDIDILVEFSQSIGLFAFVNLKNYLSEILEMQVDLVMKKALRPRIGKRILKEVVYV